MTRHPSRRGLRLLLQLRPDRVRAGRRPGQLRRQRHLPEREVMRDRHIIRDNPMANRSRRNATGTGHDRPTPQRTNEITNLHGGHTSLGSLYFVKRRYV